MMIPVLVDSLKGRRQVSQEQMKQMRRQDGESGLVEGGPEQDVDWDVVDEHSQSLGFDREASGRHWFQCGLHGREAVVVEG